MEEIAVRKLLFMVTVPWKSNSIIIYCCYNSTSKRKKIRNLEWKI